MIKFLLDAGASGGQNQSTLAAGQTGFGAQPSAPLNLNDFSNAFSAQPVPSPTLVPMVPASTEAQTIDRQNVVQ